MSSRVRRPISHMLTSLCNRLPLILEPVMSLLLCTGIPCVAAHKPELPSALGILRCPNITVGDSDLFHLIGYVLIDTLLVSSCDAGLCQRRVMYHPQINTQTYCVESFSLCISTVSLGGVDGMLAP
jgi:hypothetical protein